MTQTTQSADASSWHTKTLNKVIATSNDVATATRFAHCQVFELNDYRIDDAQPPKQHSAIGELVSKWEANESKKVALENARKWVAETFHGEDGDTVRTIRLRKGWSQTRLAQELSTSQSHVARIESGTENLALGTCRKLCSALSLDMNALDQALSHQEALRRVRK